MNPKSTSRRSRPVSEAELQQAQAAAEGRTDSTRLARQETLVNTTNLVTSDSAEDIAPPAYGDVYGEISTPPEKDGAGTSARITDDGRVNIRINPFNRRMSQVFTPALRQQAQSAEDSKAPPEPYIPPSLGGKKGVSPPPPLNIVIQVVGSRGDVQPFIALAKVLKKTYGHRIRLATHPVFKDFVQENGLEFFSIGGDPSRLMAFMVKNPGLMPGFRGIISGDVGQRRRDVGEYLQGCWRSCYQAGDGMDHDAADDDSSDLAARPFVADCIIANPPSFAHIHCAEKLGIPLHIMFTMPYSPTQAFPHPLANVQSFNVDKQLTNYISYAMIDVLVWQGLGDIINRFRKKCLALEPVSQLWAPGMLERLKIPHTYCWSPSLIAKPKDWGPHISVSGFCFLSLASNYVPHPDLQAFLDEGPPPVYIGFGSIVLDDPNAMTELIFEAIDKTGQRVLLSKGWGGMGANELDIPENVFMLGNVPHDWLFERVSCVVHHGGAGTTAAAIAAGRPTVIVPFFGDQPFWGAMVARAGAGPDPIPHKQLTADKLAAAINFCLRPESLQRAKELASKITAERGSDMAAQSFHQSLEPDRLRCTLVPSRPAVWRIRRTQVRLSAFAACTLANANLVDFHDLKMYRPQEYEVDEGPLDPLSGGGVAAYRAFVGMTMGVADIPSETYKGLRMPFDAIRKDSQASTSPAGGKSKAADVGESSTSPISLEQRHVVSRALSSSDQSTMSPSLSSASTSSWDKSESASGAVQPGLNQDTTRRPVRSQVESSSGPSKDALRQTGVHVTKGIGRSLRAFVQSPMTVSSGMTLGFHNVPKMWGDSTVRPPAQISGFKSGMVAAGNEFRYGWYDGVTGLATQPWNGAKNDGVTGFLKGFGKGIGGFVTKPNAGMLGLIGHTLKGMHKEVQKMFDSNVQSYIAASRTAQGYEEWLESSDAEKQDLIERWELVKSFLEKKRDPDETMQDVLDAQRRKNTEDRDATQNTGHTVFSTRSASTSAATLEHGSAILAMTNSQSSQRTRTSVQSNGIRRKPVRQSTTAELEGDREPVPYDTLSQHNHPAIPDYGADQNNLRQISPASEVEAPQSEKQIRHSTTAPPVLLDDSDSDSDSSLPHIAGLPPSLGGYTPSSYSQRPPSYAPSPSHTQTQIHSHQIPTHHNQSHLAGTTQHEFEAQQQGKRNEKTIEEKTEEEIVLQYVKKQSLLEAQLRDKGKGKGKGKEREVVQDWGDEEDDEDLKRVLEESMLGHMRGHGEAERDERPWTLRE